MGKRQFKTMMRLVLVGTAVLGSIKAQAEVIPDLYLHDKESLNGQWKYHVDPYELGFYDYRWQQRDQKDNPSRDAFFLDAKRESKSDLVEYNFDKAKEITVPGDWNTQEDKLYYYEGTLWYRKTFTADVDDGRTFLRFGAANYRADVYLNGKKLGMHEGGFTPFAFEATEQLKKGKNSLIVRVDNKRYKEAIPTLNTDWWNYGGLTRDVDLITVPDTFISGHQIKLVDRENGSIEGKVQLSGKKLQQTVTVSIPELKKSVKVKTDRNGVASFALSAPKLALWSPESPKMYEVDIKSDTDSITDKMGFRTIETEGKQILLNGEPVFLKGISLHEEFAKNGGGRVASHEDRKTQLDWAKSLGVNFIRLAHYPHSEDMVRLAEERGIMVWSEIPVYWTIEWTNKETYKNAETQLSDMIIRDRNRANVIIWSIANETPVKAERTQFLTNLASTARELDDTRLISAAMENHWDSEVEGLSVVEDPLAEVVDIVSFNQYIGWYGGTTEWLTRVSWRIPYDKPVFVSEFGAGAKYGLHGDKDEKWTEEYQAELYEKTVSMVDKIDGISGMSPWILTDFRSPRRLLPEIQDDFNRKGLMSEKGEKKLAFDVLKNYYDKK